MPGTYALLTPLALFTLTPRAGRPAITRNALPGRRAAPRCDPTEIRVGEPAPAVARARSTLSCLPHRCGKDMEMATRSSRPRGSGIGSSVDRADLQAGPGSSR